MEYRKKYQEFYLIRPIGSRAHSGSKMSKTAHLRDSKKPQMCFSFTITFAATRTAGQELPECPGEAL